MNRNYLRGFLQIGVFVGVGGFLLAIANPPNTPEYVVSVLSAIIGLTLVVGVVIVSYLFKG